MEGAVQRGADKVVYVGVGSRSFFFSRHLGAAGNMSNALHLAGRGKGSSEGPPVASDLSN